MVGAFRAAVEDARRRGGLSFAALLSEERILAAFGEASASWQGWVYTLPATVWTFLGQCLSADHSCVEAVARLIAWRVLQGKKPCSSETGAYCTARDKIPEEACRKLLRDAGRQPEGEAPAEWLWHGRRVRLVDGATVTLPDTPENQAEYPQQARQLPGCGFPIVRLVVIFSLAVGTVLEMAAGPFKGKRTGENSLFRTLHDALEAGDIVLADRYFSGWFDLALLLQRGVQVVIRKHQKRATDFRTGRRLGTEDHLVRWAKPSRREWMGLEEYAALPDELTLRAARPRQAAGLSHADLRGGDELAGPRGVPGRRTGAALSPTVAGGAVPAQPEVRVADGPLALPYAASSAQRTADAPDWLQSDPRCHGGRGAGVGRQSLEGELQGDAANAQPILALADQLAARRLVRHPA